VSEDDTSKAMNEAYVEAAGGEGPASDGNSFNAEPSGPSATAATGPASTKDLLIYAGLMVALISAALLSVAWFARRYFADPLLR
ncbi:MAG TPA: hypothetical protein VMZ33_05770, partial [Candidatus Limnocylindrales bacterium]|nr:hypothetical protein [Candidatus Limnocylindrales bacterium]